MRERGIIFSGRSPRAIIDDIKTQTRRIISPRHLKFIGLPASEQVANWEKRPLPYGGVGDRLWVREPYFAFGKWEWRFNTKKGRDEWHFLDMTLESGEEYLYAADGVSNTGAFTKRRSDPEPMYWKRSPLFMPRAASRILPEITEVRVQRLQNISYEEALAEGVIDGAAFCAQGDPERRHEFTGETAEETARRLEWPQRAYRNLWESLHGADSWAADPLVWAITFKRVQS